jgi:hypothetical protein
LKIENYWKLEIEDYSAIRHCEPKAWQSAVVQAHNRHCEEQSTLYVIASEQSDATIHHTSLRASLRASVAIQLNNCNT